VQDPPVVAVVGATGAAGGTLLRVLEDRLFPIGDFRAFASARSAGAVVRFRDHDVVVDVAPQRGRQVVFVNIAYHPNAREVGNRKQVGRIIERLAVQDRVQNS